MEGRIMTEKMEAILALSNADILRVIAEQT